MRENSVRSLSVHGAIALGHENEPYQVLVVLRGEAPPRFQRLREFRQADLVITVGDGNFEADCREERFGGAIASLLLFPYRLVSGDLALDAAEVEYKRHVIMESLQNLILDYRLASS
ncbi:MAG: hypothetical protein QXI18_02300, partial [Nitrososphaerota archaeon]